MRICLLILFFYSFVSYAQEYPHAEYIKKYAKYAQEEMAFSGVPASITLAQGILESGNGKSELAVNGFNHFGIKCKKHYEGKVMFVDDDEINDCFRVYESVLDSYKDHSSFLKNNQRYSELFKLNIQDYKSWAKGLKRAGYATNPKYAQLLINIIEDNRLFLFDYKDDRWIKAYNKHNGIVTNDSSSEISSDIEDVESNTSILNENKFLNKYQQVYSNSNGTMYVLAKPGDTFDRLKNRHDVWVSELKRFNELTESKTFVGGEKIYIRPKKNKAGIKEYTVKSGDTLYSIAQQFGVKQKKILKRNKLKSAEMVVEGMQLKLK